MTKTDPKVDAYIDRAQRWQGETAALRAILLDCGLEEALKWGKPCYAAQGGNVAIIQGFKPHLALMFFKGALLKDPEGVLRAQGANSQAAKRMEFTSPAQVDEMAATVRAYVAEAVAVEQAGLKVAFTAKAELVYPDELVEAFDTDPAFAAAFKALTPGRQRAYVLHFSGAKQAATRAARIAKVVGRVLDGKGLADR
jgi:uncharacterized protein YdeI (YjbR/CyaY-like superfamily)